MAGGAWPERARQAASVLEGSIADEDESITVQLFTDIYVAFERHGDDKMSSAKLVEYLHDMEDRPWPEYGRSRKPITTVQMARLLRRHRIAPGTIRLGETTAKGYRLQAFKNAFARYIPPFEPSQRHNPQETAENRQFQGVTLDPNVTVQKPLKAADSLACDVVTAGNEEKADARLFEGVEDDSEERAAIQEFDGEGS